MKASMSTIGRHLTVALIGGLMSTALALPASNSAGGSGGDFPPPKPAVKSTTPLPPPPAAMPAATASTSTLPAGTYTLLVRVQGRLFEAPMLLARNGNAVVLHPEGSRDELRGDINNRGEVTLEYVEPAGHRLTLRGPVQATGAAGPVSYTDGVRSATGSFELVPDSPSAARKAKQGCDASCQAMIRWVTAEMKKIMKVRLN